MVCSLYHAINLIFEDCEFPKTLILLSLSGKERGRNRKQKNRGRINNRLFRKKDDAAELLTTLSGQIQDAYGWNNWVSFFYRLISTAVKNV